jgi:hypothetical protein
LKETILNPSAFATKFVATVPTISWSLSDFEAPFVILLSCLTTLFGIGSSAVIALRRSVPEHLARFKSSPNVYISVEFSLNVDQPR